MIMTHDFIVDALEFIISLGFNINKVAVVSLSLSFSVCCRTPTRSSEEEKSALGYRSAQKVSELRCLFLFLAANTKN